MSKVHRYLTGILILSAALRLVALSSRGIWYDDAFSYFLSARPLAAIFAGTAADTMPPFYYLLLHAWLQISEAVWFLRLLNVILSIFTVLVLYGLVARMFNPVAGLWAALLAAISPLQIYQAQELRSYALLALCQAGYALFFVRIWQKRSSVGATGSPGAPDRMRMPLLDWAGLVLCGAGAMYSHNLAAFIIIIPDLYLLFRRDWRMLWRLALAQAAIGVLLLPWLAYLPGQLAKIQGGWSIPLPGLVEVIQSIVIFTSNLPLPGLWLAVALLIALQAMALTGFELAHQRLRGNETVLLAFFAILPPVLMLLVSYLLRPVFVTRGFIFSALAYDGLAGLAIARRWRTSGMLLAGLFVIGALVALPYQYTFREFPRSPFQAAGQYLDAIVQPGDRVVHDNKLSFFPMHYYAPNLPQSFVADIPASENDTLSPGSQAAMDIYPEKDLEAAVGDSRKVYFIDFDQAEKDYASLGLPVHPSLNWLRKNFSEKGQQKFADLSIYEFER